MSDLEFVDFGVLADQIAVWLRMRLLDANASRLVLGLSGGVDSAVVCALAVRAVGSSNVVAAVMPIHSLELDKVDAEIVAAAFDVKPITIDLAPTYEVLLDALEPQNDEEVGSAPSLARSNIKPRLRMTTLYYFSQRHNGLVVGTGNKIELNIGYFTKYGDGGVDLLPLADLSKSEVRALALELGVPASIIAKPPSAGLWEGQTDERELGLTYEQIERVILPAAASRSAEVDPLLANRVLELISRSDHKRDPIPTFRRDTIRMANDAESG